MIARAAIGRKAYRLANGADRQIRAGTLGLSGLAPRSRRQLMSVLVRSWGRDDVHVEKGRGRTFAPLFAGYGAVFHWAVTRSWIARSWRLDGQELLRPRRMRSVQGFRRSQTAATRAIRLCPHEKLGCARRGPRSRNVVTAHDTRPRGFAAQMRHGDG